MGARVTPGVCGHNPEQDHSALLRAMPLLRAVIATAATTAALLALLSWGLLPPLAREALLARLPGLGVALLCAAAAGAALGWQCLRETAAWPQRAARRLERLRALGPAARAGEDDRLPPQLLAGINGVAHEWRAAIEQTQAAVDDATRALAAERDLLAAISRELQGAVVACNDTGQVRLYTPRAAALLGETAELGIGRSIFAFFRRSAIQRGLDAMQNDTAVVRTLPLQTRDGRQLHARFTPLHGPGLDGFLISLSADEAGAAPPADTPVWHAASLPSDGLPSAQRPLSELILTALDTETTGLDPGAGDEIIAVGAIRIVGGRLLSQEVFESLVATRRPVSLASQRIHGIDPSMLANQPDASEVLPRLARFCADSVLLGHNLAFDLRFLAMQGERVGARFAQPALDTLLLSQLLHGQDGAHDLEALAERLGVSVLGRHTALGDAILTAEVFLRMIPILEYRGFRTLQQLQDAAQQMPYARLRY